MQNGRYYFQDEFSRRPKNAAELDEAVRSAKEKENMLDRFFRRHQNDEN